MKKLPILLFLTLIPSLVFAQSANQNIIQSANQNLSVADLQKLVQDLVKQVQALQQQVAALQGELGKQSGPQVTPIGETPITSGVPGGVSSAPAVAEATPPEIARYLSRGASGDDVRKLQEFLAKDKNVYPGGLITGYFGPLTETAVKRWQEKYGIEPVGVIGPKTIAKFQELGREVIQGLMNQGAGMSGVVPSGLLTAPGIQNGSGFATTTAGQATSTTYGFVTSTLAGATTTFIGTTSTTPVTSTQPSLNTGLPGTTATSGTSTSTQSTTTSTITTTTTTSSTAQASYPPPSHSCGTPVNVPQDTPSIQAALNAACPGDTVYVAAGTYVENVVVPKENLTLKGAPGTSPGNVIIEAQNSTGYVISTGGTDYFTVEGLTLQGGLNRGSNSFGAAGLFANSGSTNKRLDITVRNLIVKNNTYGIQIINFNSGSINIEKNLITGNTFAGIEVSHNGSSAVLNVTNNTIANNTGVYGGYYDGGGIVGDTRVFRNNIFANNYAGITSWGGLTWISDLSNSNVITILYNDFWNNTNGNYINWRTGGSFTPSPATGELKVDPQFVNPTDYHLQATSPVINAGDPSSQYNDSNGTRNDMGAFPFTGTSSPPPSTTTSSTATSTTSTATSTTNTAPIRVTYPNGGETWDYGYNQSIGYSLNGVSRIGFKLLKGSQVIYDISSPITNSTQASYNLNNQSSSLVGSGSDYKIRVYDWDNLGVYDDSDNYFSILPADITPPVVSLVLASSITANSAVITWTTDEPALGYVNYGSTPSDWAITPYDNSWAGYVTSHSYTLLNLKSSTLYTFRVYNIDKKGNSAVLSTGYPPEHTFMTTGTTTSTLSVWQSNLASILSLLSEIVRELQKFLR